MCEGEYGVFGCGVGEGVVVVVFVIGEGGEVDDVGFVMVCCGCDEVWSGGFGYVL